MIAARQTAIVLAGLPRVERDWVLAHLAPARARALASLVEEARHLGIRAEGTMLAELIDTLDRRASPEDALAYLDLARAEVLCSLLADSPAMLIARLLAAHPWRWREAFIARFSGPQKREVIDVLHAQKGEAPKLAQALIEEVAARLRASPALAPHRIANKNAWLKMAALIKAMPLIRRGVKR
jgi:hypothetical protein